MTYAADFPELLEYFVTKLNDNKDSLLLADVWEGEQNLIPRYPAVTVFAGELDREAARVSIPVTIRRDFVVYMMVYHGGAQDTQVTERQTLERTAAIRALFDQDTTAGGLVIFGLFQRSEPGYLRKTNSLARVTRLTWSGFNQGLVTA